MRCSKQLSYEAAEIGGWSIRCSYVGVKEMNVIDVYEINHIRTAEMKSNEAGVILAVVNEIYAIS